MELLPLPPPHGIEIISTSARHRHNLYPFYCPSLLRSSIAPTCALARLGGLRHRPGGLVGGWGRGAIVHVLHRPEGGDD